MKTFTIDADKFLKREKKLIEYLKSRNCVPAIAKAAGVASTMFGSRGYTFEATWSATNYGKEMDITIAGMIEIGPKNSFSLYTYCFCVLQNNKIMRKYHYDYETQTNGSKPKFHLQYGGKKLPSQESVTGFTAIESGLSEPRLFYTPMSLALVLDQAFLEFPDDKTERIRKDNNWMGHLNTAQKEVLAPFFGRCLEKITNKERLYFDCYV